MSALRKIIGLFAAIISLLPYFYCAAEDAANPAAVLQVSIGQTFDPEEENKLAEVEGTVTFAGSNGREVYLEISTGSGSMPVTVAHGAGLLNDLLMKSRVRVRGIYKAVHSNAAGKITASLSATNETDVTVLQVPEETWQYYPPATVDALPQTNFPGGFIHLCGEVQSVEPGFSFLLAGQTNEAPVVSKSATADLAGTEIEALCFWRQDGSNKVLQAGLVRSLAQATNDTSLPTLTTTEQIRWLKPKEAARGYPVKMQAVVAYLPETRRRDGNIQDSSGGIFAWHLMPSDGGTAVRPGDFCEIEGNTAPGQFAPGVYCHKLKILGRGKFPEPVRPKWDELASGSLDQQWVEIEGVALSSSNQRLQIGTQGGQIACYVVGGTNLERFLNATVLVRGIVAVNWDELRHIQGVHLNLPSQESIALETSPLSDPFSLPAKQIKDLLFYDPGKPAFRRQKVDGEIIGARDGVCYLTDGTNGLRLNLGENDKLAAGDTVEAVGFPEIDYSTKPPLVALREAVARVTGRKPLPAATSVAAINLLASEHDSTLVQLEAKLVHLGVYGSNQVLELQSGARTFFARLNISTGIISQLPADSELEITGVYVFNNGKTTGRVEAGPFELILNSPADVRVLELPSWWTARHAAMVVGGMALIILLGMFWITILHQQVNRRTVQLSAANQSLKMEMAERQRAEDALIHTRSQHLIEQERTRIAKDLHDDLGASMTRMTLLLELATQPTAGTTVMTGHLQEGLGAAREAIKSLDAAVWAVNPRNNTLPELIDYIGQFGMEFLQHANIQFELDLPDHPAERPVSAELRHNLFLIVKEALNNAARHAEASIVCLRIVVTDEILALRIEDNGCGFEKPPNNSSADGLRNMRQRAEGIGGECRIESKPGKGTRVSVEYHWPKSN